MMYKISLMTIHDHNTDSLFRTTNVKSDWQHGFKKTIAADGRKNAAKRVSELVFHLRLC